MAGPVAWLSPAPSSTYRVTLACLPKPCQLQWLVMSNGSKLLGEEVELGFMLAAVRQGYAVSKPFGDSSKYDAIVDHGHRLSRVQVKSCSGYSISAVSGGRTNRRTYSIDEIDFLVAYVRPLDAWFVIPVAAVKRNLRFYADRRPTELDQFKNAWHLFKNQTHDAVTTAASTQAGLPASVDTHLP